MTLDEREDILYLLFRESGALSRLRTWVQIGTHARRDNFIRTKIYINFGFMR